MKNDYLNYFLHECFDSKHYNQNKCESTGTGNVRYCELHFSETKYTLLLFYLISFFWYFLGRFNGEERVE